MDYPQSEIRREIESTRAEMVEKISTLESRVGGAIEEIKRLADIRYQTEHRPWLMMGLSMGLGYVISRLIFARPKRRTAIVHYPDDGTTKRIPLGWQGSGFVGGIVSSVAVALARDFAMNLLSKRASRRRADYGKSDPIERPLKPS